MGKMLLGIMGGIAAIGLTASATAGTPEDPFAGVPNAKVALGTFGGSGSGGAERFGRSGRSGSGGVWVNGGEWARYNNSAWTSDGFNDWWHDRPDRAYPAWMRNNQNCQRQWYAGNVLRC